MRWVNMMAFVAVCAMAVTLYLYKNETRQLEARVADLQHQIQKERATIAVLKTEWSHLTRPKRLERLARQYLNMTPVQAHQIVTPGIMTGAITPAAHTDNIAKVINQTADKVQNIH